MNVWLSASKMIEHLLAEYHRSELDEIIRGIEGGRGGTRVREPRIPGSPDPSEMMAGVSPSIGQRVVEQSDEEPPNVIGPDSYKEARERFTRDLD
jgi:hypothetical protein